MRCSALGRLRPLDTAADRLASGHTVWHVVLNRADALLGRLERICRLHLLVTRRIVVGRELAVFTVRTAPLLYVRIVDAYRLGLEHVQLRIKSFELHLFHATHTQVEV